MTALPRGEPVDSGGASGELPPEIQGVTVLLRRPDPAGDTPLLFAATHGSAEREAVWAYMGYGPWTDETAMRTWVEATLPSKDPFWWTVEVGGVPVGMATVMSRDATHRRAEIGHIWYVPEAHRTTINTEAAYLMIRECFERLGCRRVEWKCDALNERSRIAALRLGFVFEGVFRHHMIIKGRNRDTAWFAMTLDDWTMARPALEKWLYRTPRDAEGRPTSSLLAVRSPGSAS
ncbi:MAG: GNAT family N-acetyltransferase [Acidimicrobiia bacterium]|nr:GNAT family N-acetyltransferase [Acidimicrobiia bacterium]